MDDSVNVIRKCISCGDIDDSVKLLEAISPALIAKQRYDELITLWTSCRESILKAPTRYSPQLRAAATWDYIVALVQRPEPPNQQLKETIYSALDDLHSIVTDKTFGDKSTRRWREAQWYQDCALIYGRCLEFDRALKAVSQAISLFGECYDKQKKSDCLHLRKGLRKLKDLQLIEQ